MRSNQTVVKKEYICCELKTDVCGLLRVHLELHTNACQICQLLYILEPSKSGSKTGEQDYYACCGQHFAVFKLNSITDFSVIHMVAKQETIQRAVEVGDNNETFVVDDGCFKTIYRQRFQRQRFPCIPKN
ncbi:hypothetical protein CAEBREN_16856 [Caenorhabditis brenneri]|uniref:Uncharacterized protein n=1 Tax=Caenorhabditis brenneri TaxID=135651 RepID=G0NGL3_CAEBE|nr:hypothetical protein CAEBREN_16856 [Caenorhabditis brenneri]